MYSLSAVLAICEHTFVLSKRIEQRQARALRAEGWSLGRIARELGVAKSSVSVWVRDVPLPPPVEPPPQVLDPRSKTCGRCRRERSFSHFNRAGDGLQHWCRDCFREYFRARGELHLRQVKESTRRRTAAACALVRARLIAEACVDCGEDEIAVLEFDHVRDKRGGLARMAHEGAELEEIEAELAKCEVVCASCHRRRTATRAGWARATGVPGENWTAVRRRNHAYVLEVLTRTGCVDCGERDPVLLEFDHIGPKKAKVGQLAISASLERLKAEIAECEVRCCNCHRLVTYARRGGTWRDAPAWSEGG